MWELRHHLWHLHLHVAREHSIHVWSLLGHLSHLLKHYVLRSFLLSEKELLDKMRRWLRLVAVRTETLSIQWQPITAGARRGWLRLLRLLGIWLDELWRLILIRLLVIGIKIRNLILGHRRVLSLSHLIYNLRLKPLQILLLRLGRNLHSWNHHCFHNWPFF